MIRTALFAGVCALALSACGGSGDPAAPATEAAAAPAAPAAPPAESAAAAAPAAKGAKPDKAFMVGKWATEGDCDMMAIDFKADGSMVGPFEKWELDDGKLTMVGNPQKMHLTVIDSSTMESRIGGTGTPNKLVRCK